ncbi:uncharacterized protein [Arachis hypogaea]|uniref:uncharacterized protein n=1 Tax=Arachis hypogaea TaxID=3818 RepID=UPI003B211A1F
MEIRKFLGFMITQRGVEANLDKCKAVLRMTSPGFVKNVQRLAGKLTAISRFLGASAAKALPFINLMRKGIPSNGPWPAKRHSITSRRYSRHPCPQQTKRRRGFISIFSGDGPSHGGCPILQLIYFVSKVLHGAELRYTRLEKLAYALLVSSQRLRQYFQGHSIVVRTDQAIH